MLIKPGTAVLRHALDASPDRFTALAMRAEARYRTQRVRDALADLDEAMVIARALGNRDAEARIELRRATALDWADDWDASAAAAARARKLLRNTPSIDADLAEARSLFRAQKFAEAQPKLAGRANRRTRKAQRRDGDYRAPPRIDGARRPPAAMTKRRKRSRN